MKAVRSFCIWLAAVVLVCPVQAAEPITARDAKLDNVQLHYLTAGHGAATVILLHGFAETSRMWRSIIPTLAEKFTVIAPDLPGIGDSSIPDKIDMLDAAKQIHELARSLKIEKARVVGHDIGLMVAYAYAAQYPTEVERIALLDAFLPGIGNTEGIFLLRDKWHFNFYGETPLKLVKGRERIYFEHFWNDFAANPKKSVSEADRRFYTKAYAQPGGMRAGFEVFRAFYQDAKDFAAFAKSKLKMPMLVLTGEKASGQFLIDQGRLVASNVEGVIVKGSGHWLMDEARAKVVPKLVDFFSR